MDINKLLETGKQTAAALQNPELAAYVSAHAGPPENPEVNILFLSEPHTKPLAFLGTLIPDFPLEDARTQGSFRIEIGYGEADTWEWTDPTGTSRTVPLQTFLTCLAENESGLFRGRIQVNREFLKDKRITLFSSAEEYRDAPMEELLMGSDHCMMNMLAIKLLSAGERNLIRNYLSKYMSDRMSLVIVGCNHLVDDGFPQVQQYLESYTKGGCPVYYLPGPDQAKLEQGIAAMAADQPQARAAARVCYGRLYSEFLTASLDAAMANLGLENDRLDEAIDAMDSLNARLSKRAERAMRNVRLDHLNVLEADCEETLLEFRSSMEEMLTREIAAQADLQKLQTVVPRYIQDMWGKQLDALYAYMSRQLEQVPPYLEEFIARDINDSLLEMTSPDLSEMILRITNDYNARSSKVPSGQFDIDGRSKASFLCTGTVAAGVAMLLLSFPITGLLTIASSGLVYKAENQKYLAESRQQLCEAAHQRNDEIYEAAVAEVHELMQKNGKSLTAGVKSCYDNISQNILTALADKKQSRGSNADTIGTLAEIKNQVTACL